MICQLQGRILETSFDRDLLRVVVDVHGVGYEVWMAKAHEGRLREGESATLLISESVTAFDGATTLYGFVTREEKDLYNRLRENVDGMGPRKAMDVLDKISRSLPDFRRAVIDGDGRLLVSVFGFTKKTAEKLIFALKGKMDSWSVTGSPKWQEAPRSSMESDVLSALVNLGYDEPESRELLQRAKTAAGDSATVESLVKEALRLSSLRLSN